VTETADTAAVHQAVEDAVARERARMARELHDSVATDLAGAISLFKVYVEGHPGLAKKGPEGTLLNVLEILERMLKQVRETLADLRPRPIGPEGLLGDIRHQAEEFARLYSIRVEISTNGT
jgi:signal transduction histidine kinase